MVLWAFTIHKAQNLSLEKSALSFDFQKQGKFWQDQMYKALSRVSSYDKILCVQKFEPLSIKVTVSALQEHEHLHQKSSCKNIEKICVNDDTTTILL